MLDEDLGTTAEVAASLHDLRHINRWFGGVATTTNLLRRIFRETHSHKLSLLEVGAGAGDTPLTAQKKLAAEGLQLQVVLLDRVWSHLPRNGAASIAGDAAKLPIRDNSFDVVSCTLLAHHFEPDRLQAFIAEALRVTRRAVLINDLIRSRLHLALVYSGLPLFRSRITWHDAPASVRRAYTCAEMHKLLQEAPATRREISRHYLFRMGALLWK
jgi:ubiquinone/menaquinone biosynthesis C-methylase UbiE